MTTTIPTLRGKTLELDSLKHLSLILRSSDATRERKEDETLALYASFMDTMQQQIMSLADKNRTLSTTLITVESQHRELELLHKTEVTALQEKAKTSEDAVEAMRKEMENTMQKADEMVRAALAREEAAVKAAKELADARVAAAKQEVETQMKVQRAELLKEIREKVQNLSNNITSYIRRAQSEQKSAKDNLFWKVFGEGSGADAIKSFYVDPFINWLRGLQ